jgi:hypothetical protein
MTKNASKTLFQQPVRNTRKADCCKWLFVITWTKCKDGKIYGNELLPEEGDGPGTEWEARRT